MKGKLMEEDEPLTREELMTHWQLCRIAIDFKNKHLTRKEAIAEFSKWSGMPSLIAWMMLDPMRKETIWDLRKSFPKWINKEDEPKFKDTTYGTRKTPYTKGKPRGMAVARKLKQVPPEQSGDTPP
jgi:hypothetical protein